MSTSVAEGPFQKNAFLIPLPTDSFQLHIDGRQFLTPVLGVCGRFGGEIQSLLR